MSQKEFSDKIGVSNSRVSNWEQGINRSDVDILSSICRTLSVSPSELLDISVPLDELSAQERNVINQYRAKPEMQHAVHLILGIYADQHG